MSAWTRRRAAISRQADGQKLCEFRFTRREDELDLLLDFLSPVSEEPGGGDEVSSDASASAAATSLGSEPTTEEGENRE